jgi:hypothetical protein
MSEHVYNWFVNIQPIQFPPLQPIFHVFEHFLQVLKPL